MLVAVSAAMALLSPLFLTAENLSNLGFQSAIIACLALGQLLVILTRGIDISVGSIVGLVVALGSVLYLQYHISDPVVVVVMLLAGAAVGTFNGVVFVKGRLPHSFIVTLATYGIVRGLAFLITAGYIGSGQPPSVLYLAAHEVGPVPDVTILVVLMAGLAWLFTRQMKWGRWIYAIGGNSEAARRAGMPVDRVLISVYILSGIAAAVAGIITAGRIGVGDPNAGQLYELDAIAAVMIGGVAFTGGRGGVSNALIGALTVTVIRNGLDLLGVTGYAELILVGLVIVAAVELNVVRDHLESRFRVIEAAAIETRGGS